VYRDKPALILLLMTLWWALPLFALHLWRYPSAAYLPSHTLYCVIIGLAIITALGVTLGSSLYPYWKEASLGERYYWLCAAYTAQMVVTLTTVLMLDTYQLIDYYDGDAAGSVGMLFLPSVLFYFALGVLGRWILRLHAWLTRKRGNSR